MIVLLAKALYVTASIKPDLASQQWRVFDNYLWWHSMEMRASKNCSFVSLKQTFWVCRLVMISINDQNEIRSLCCLHTVYSINTQYSTLSVNVPLRAIFFLDRKFLLYINKMQEVTNNKNYMHYYHAISCTLVPFIGRFYDSRWLRGGSKLNRVHVLAWWRSLMICQCTKVEECMACSSFFIRSEVIIAIIFNHTTYYYCSLRL